MQLIVAQPSLDLRDVEGTEHPDQPPVRVGALVSCASVGRASVRVLVVLPARRQRACGSTNFGVTRSLQRKRNRGSRGVIRAALTGLPPGPLTINTLSRIRRSGLITGAKMMRPHVEIFCLCHNKLARCSRHLARRQASSITKRHGLMAAIKTCVDVVVADSQNCEAPLSSVIRPG
jgi:hypothetical protein